MSSEDTDLWIVDSVEDGIAALEGPGDRTVHLPADWLPEGAEEGSALRVSVSEANGGTRQVELRVDTDATKGLRARVREQVSRLAERDPGGDLAL